MGKRQSHQERSERWPGPALAGFVDRLTTWHFILNGVATPGRVLNRGRAWMHFGFVWLPRVWTKDCRGPRDDGGFNHRKSTGAVVVVRSGYFSLFQRKGWSANNLGAG